MNENESLPPLVPNPALPPVPPRLPDPWTPAPLGSLADEKVPIQGWIAAVEALLRQPRRIVFQLCQPGAERLIMTLLGVAVLCSLVYGAIAGTFSGGTQLWAAPVKIAGGLLVSVLICLPSLYIFSCLSGAQIRLVEVAGLAAAMLAILSVLLIGFGPVAWVFSQSTESVAAMGALHLLFGLVAAGFGLRFLFTAFLHFRVERKAGLAVWAVIFLLVGLQMTTALRPMVGTAPTFLPQEKMFFLDHWCRCLETKGQP